MSSLRLRLLLLVLLALVPALGVIIYTASEQRQMVAAQTQENALRLARTVAGNQEQLIEAAHQLLMALAEVPAIRDGDPAACNQFLADLPKHYPHYNIFGVADRQGNLLCRTNPTTEPTNIGSDSLVQMAFDTKDFTVGDYRIKPDGGATLGFGYPLFDAAGHMQTMILAAVDLDWLARFVDTSLMPPGSTLTLTDRHGTVVARVPDPDKWLGRSLPEAALARIMGGQQAEGTFEARDADNVPRLYAFSTLRRREENVIYISVGIPTSVAFASTNQLFARNLIFLGLAAILALAAAWVFSDLFVLRQVRALLDATGRLSAGDLSARSGTRYGVDELSQLARAFDRMVAALQQREEERNRAQERITQEERARAQLLHQVITAQEDERVRIARELHDETSQSLVTLMVGLDQANMFLSENPTKAAGFLRTAKFIAEGLIDDVHGLIEGLRPTLLDLLGLESAIIWYGEQRLAPLGIVLNFEGDGLEDRLPVAMKTTFFRIAQEALTNVLRHAQATQVDVSLKRHDGHLILRVQDNGQGFDPAQQEPGQGFGLLGIQERIGILGGEFHVETTPGQGTLIEVCAPMCDAEDNHDEDPAIGS